mmetsp:Transcript_60452/g.122745  ORF Transcript_60452/g.122745 Transcript_60452/m.122745 type:complete len:244 (-) Transcript_60452:644-1375(-)
MVPILRREDRAQVVYPQQVARNSSEQSSQYTTAQHCQRLPPAARIAACSTHATDALAQKGSQQSSKWHTQSGAHQQASNSTVTNFEVEQANPIIGGVQVGKTILWCTHHICHAVSTDHETIIALLILRLDVVTMFVTIHVFQTPAEAGATGNLEEGSTDLRHRHPLAAAQTFVIPVPQQENDLWLRFCKVYASCLQMWQGFIKFSCSSISQETNVAKLVVEKKVAGIIQKPIPLAMLIRINIE